MNPKEHKEHAKEICNVDIAYVGMRVKILPTAQGGSDSNIGRYGAITSLPKPGEYCVRFSAELNDWDIYYDHELEVQ